MLRVLYLVTAYARHSGEPITPWLAETIHRLRRHRVDVEVLAPSYAGLGSHVVDGVRVHRFRYAPRALEHLTHDQTTPDRLRERPHELALVPGYVAAGTLAAARLARSGGFHVLHAFWPLPHGVMGLAAKRASGVPLVCTFFGVELTWLERDFPVLAPAVRAVVRGSDAVTAISTYTAARLARVAPRAAPDIIPFGAVVQDAERAAAVAPAGRCQLLFIGRLVERKGVHILLQAMTRVRNPEAFRLHVAGDGPERRALEALVHALGLGDRVRFLGRVDEEEKARELSTCHALVLPAVVDAKGDTEGLGVVLLEAMTLGKPVIASRVGGIVDIVHHGANGWLTTPGDLQDLAAAMDALHADPGGARARGEAGRQHVAEHFSWDAITARLAALYQRLADTRARSTG